MLQLLSALLKSDAAENSTFPFAMALGSALPHTACQSDSALLKSDVRQKRGFGSHEHWVRFHLTRRARLISLNNRDLPCPHHLPTKRGHGYKLYQNLPAAYPYPARWLIHQNERHPYSLPRQNQNFPDCFH